MSGKEIRETLGVLAVVASVVFVRWEIRQNTIAARASAYQEIGSSTAELWRAAREPEIASLILIAAGSSRWSEIDEVGWRQLRSMVGEGLRIWETLFLQVEEGLLPPGSMERFGWGADPRSYWPYFDRFWPEFRGLVNRDFAEFVDAQIDEVQ